MTRRGFYSDVDFVENEEYRSRRCTYPACKSAALRPVMHRTGVFECLNCKRIYDDK